MKFALRFGNPASARVFSRIRKPGEQAFHRSNPDADWEFRKRARATLETIRLGLMKIPAIVVLGTWIVTADLVAATDGKSALDALAVLPPDAASRVAMIIGNEGNPSPERWRFLVWDAHAENGFREYVVTENKIVAKNLVSQFAARINPQEVLSPETIRVDSDKAAWLALQYAKANDILVWTLRYTLRRPPELSGPVWKIDCFDAVDQQVGSLSLAAKEGKVIARLGFANEPSEAILAEVSSAAASKAKATPKGRNTGSTARRTVSQPPQSVAERVQRATPARPERVFRPFRLFRFGRD
jgi:hypothetical protein